MPILRRYGRRKDPLDVRDRIFRYRATPLRLASAIDLRPNCGPVKNQATEGCCTAASGSSFGEWVFRAKLRQSPVLSMQDLYANELIADGDFPNDNGSTTRTTCKVLASLGICLESMYPFVPGNIVQPSSLDAQNALLYKMGGYYRLTSSMAAVAVMASSNPWPVLIGFDAYESLETDQVAQTGIYNPQQGEAYVGGHQVLAVGYDIGTTPTLRPAGCPPAVLCMNSWDTDWGLAGFFWMAQGVLDVSDTDLWTLYSPAFTLSLGQGATVAPANYGAPPGNGFQEWDAAGNQLMPKGPMQYQSDTPAVVTVDASGNVVAVALGSANVTVTDLANGLSATTQVQVMAA